MIEGSVNAASVHIHYRINGKGPETLVLVNGVGDDLEAWANQLDDFVSAGLRVITFATELELSQFHLAGVSMGGGIAQEYAIAHGNRLRSLVLANTYAAPDPFTRAAFESWAIVAEAAGMAVMVRQQAPWIYSPTFYEQHPGRIAELIGEAQKSTQPAAAFAAQTAALIDHDARVRVPAITTPTLVIAAHDDVIISEALSRRLYEALPEATWSVVPGGHAAFWEDPAPWNRAVIDFVRAHGAL